ncbi:MAG: O-antigen ligase family protein [Clostridia bacterium]|nr:O-antigen ligase family protein [Clostridia bacterium]
MQKQRIGLNTDICGYCHKFAEALPEKVPEYLSAICAGLFIVTPFFIGAFCMILKNADFLVYGYPFAIEHIVWPIAAVLGVVSMLLYCIKGNSKCKHIKTTLKTNPAFVCFLFLSIWMIAATSVNGWNGWVLSGAGFRHETIFMQLGYFCLLFPSAVIIKNATVKWWIVRVFEFTSLFLVIVAFVLWKTQLTSQIISWKQQFSAIFSNTNYYGYYLAVSVSLSAAGFVAETRIGWKLLSAFSVCANSVALAFNNTMGAWVACFVAIVFLLIAHAIIEHKLNWQVAVVFLIFAVSLYLPGHIQGHFENNIVQLGNDIIKIAENAEGAKSAGSGRWQLWTTAGKMIISHPLFGIGFEGIDVNDLKEFAGNYRVHNEYLQYALFYGIPAGLAYFAGCLTVYLRALKRRHKLDPVSLVCLTGAFGYLVSAFFGLTLFGTAPLLFIFLGMGYQRAEKGE